MSSKLPFPRRVKNFLEKPIDFGYKLGNNEIFGSHKTFRGFVLGILTTILIAWIQSLLYLNSFFFSQNTLIDYSKINFIIVGFLMGFGALFGDLVESFIKRRLGKPPGEPWFPWDEVDWITGALVFVAMAYIPPLKELVTTIIIYILIHLGSDRITYLLGKRKKIKR